MPQTRRMRRIRSSGDSTWPAQEQMPGGSSSHASAPQPPTCVTRVVLVAVPHIVNCVEPST